MRILALWMLLVATVLAQTYNLLGTVSVLSGSLEVWSAAAEGKQAIVIKVRELSKPGEVNFIMEAGQVHDFQAHCEELLKDRTQLKPDSVHLVSTLKSGATSVDFALVRIGKSETLRVLVVKSDGNERNFLLDGKSWPELRKILKKATV